MQKEIKHKVFFSQAPEEVWEYLTKSELIEQWLMKNDFKPVAGHEFNFTTKPMPNYGFDGMVYCKVLEILPYEKLSYSWKGGPGNGKFNLDSVVEWTLHLKENGTELELVHSGFNVEENINMYTIMNDGWFKNMHKIGELLNNKQNDSARS